ncbi:protein inscuteable homolog [Gigantopelta aegis]|uniref:protein inscuteable homolog n=1 Tax=Gigantopelta aegis TaxID=1735272 RepID=UPI001B8886E1|nr:protein inscuteable homolog [Gigantopelta aegis]XP_041352581.1 protein inscuteable homolog [Gigantopelta aegis]
MEGRSKSRRMDDAVKKWLLELRDVTETECMSVLQGKSLNCKKDPDQTAYLVNEIKDVVNSIRTESNAISSDFDTLFRSVECGDWKHLGHHGIQVTCHIRSLIQLCNKCIREPPVHILEQQELVMGECAKLAQLVDGFSHGGRLPAKVPLTNQLTYLGQSFSRLVDHVLGYLVQKLVDLLDEASAPSAVNSAIESFISLGLDGEHMCYILAREGGVRSLLDICRTDSLVFAHSQALRALATLSCVPESIMEFERENGLELLTELLCDSAAPECVQGEAAGVVAQITSPCLEHNQHLGGFVDNIQDLLQALLNLSQKTKSREVFLLAAAATANMTFIDSTACEILHQNEAHRILVQQCSLPKAGSLFAKDQVATILANMAAVNSCLVGLTDNQGIELLVSFLKESPSLCASEAEMAACERVQQKSAIALTRLCREESYAQRIIDLEGIPRLVKLCRSSRERNNSDAVLVASLAALRKISSTCGNKNVSDADVQQLIAPRLMDSFLMCSRSDENFV